MRELKLKVKGILGKGVIRGTIEEPITLRVQVPNNHILAQNLY